MKNEFKSYINKGKRKFGVFIHLIMQIKISSFKLIIEKMESTMTRFFKVAIAFLGIAALIPLSSGEMAAKEKKLTILYSSAANGYLLPCG
ncbi:MAG: hypothetical protein DWQ05_15495 [Calditrichaeota bacterium]|nr:MAG: hypothetical protein DWQ05_15495 [Calditrichota bacterium]